VVGVGCRPSRCTDKDDYEHQNNLLVLVLVVVYGSSLSPK
jgi:hypothetical protein